MRCAIEIDQRFRHLDMLLNLEGGKLLRNISNIVSNQTNIVSQKGEFLHFLFTQGKLLFTGSKNMYDEFLPLGIPVMQYQ